MSLPGFGNNSILIKTPEKKIITGEAIGFDIRVTWLAILKMFNPLALKFGLTTSMGFALLNINEEHGTAATKIAPLLGMEPRSLTRMLKKLELQKLISRKADPKDGRSVRIYLTESGKKGKALAMEFVREFNLDIRNRVPAAKLQVFYEVLEEIYTAADQGKIRI